MPKIATRFFCCCKVGYGPAKVHSIFGTDGFLGSQVLLTVAHIVRCGRDLAQVGATANKVGDRVPQVRIKGRSVLLVAKVLVLAGLPALSSHCRRGLSCYGGLEFWL